MSEFLSHLIYPFSSHADFLPMLIFFRLFLFNSISFFRRGWHWIVSHRAYVQREGPLAEGAGHDHVQYTPRTTGELPRTGAHHALLSRSLSPDQRFWQLGLSMSGHRRDPISPLFPCLGVLLCSILVLSFQAALDQLLPLQCQDFPEIFLSPSLFSLPLVLFFVCLVVIYCVRSCCSRSAPAIATSGLR